MGHSLCYQNNIKFAIKNVGFVLVQTDEGRLHALVPGGAERPLRGDQAARLPRRRPRHRGGGRLDGAAGV